MSAIDTTADPELRRRLHATLECTEEHARVARLNLSRARAATALGTNGRCP